jgi:LysR family positive regulator for ilvC
MDRESLRLFLHLSETLHFLRTSRACHVSPSALSRTISRMEADVGKPLFERDRRTVRLTPEGARFVLYARETLERWERLQRELTGPKGRLTGTISIFASVEMLDQGRVDVAVAALPDRVPRALVARVLLHTPLVFVAPTASCEVERMCALRPLPWGEVPVVLPSTGIARQNADRWFRRRGVTPVVYGEVPGSEALLSLVALGCGVGVVPRIVLRANIRVLANEADATTLGEFRVGVCTPRRKLALPLVRAFWDAIDRDAVAL